MPTFATIPFQNLVEPRVSDSTKKPLAEDPATITTPHLYVSPMLYVTPEQAPISDCPLSPSPYLANQKRRRGGNERGSGVPEFPSGDETDGFCLEEVPKNFLNQNDDAGDDDSTSEVDVNDFSGSQFETRSFASAQGEFFDAIDGFSSDGSVHSSSDYKLESELHASRLSLLEEIERRETAEETLTLMRSQWERIRKLMSEAGFTFPAANDSVQQEDRLIDQMTQDLYVARFVAEAVGRGEARAEAEEATSAIIELKDQEISRLRDRLQYYETVNHEMSQRKLLEAARRQQERKRNRRRWLWSFVGLSIAMGASLAAYSYVPHTREWLSLLNSGDSTDASSMGGPETSQK